MIRCYEAQERDWERWDGVENGKQTQIDISKTILYNSPLGSHPQLQAPQFSEDIHKVECAYLKETA